MLIEITKKELIDIISNYCLDYGVLCDSFIEKNYGYIGYDRFSDAKGFQWNYEELEKLSEEELYNIYQKLITCIDYSDESLEVFLKEGFGYYDYGTGDYKEYFWNLEELEKLSEYLLYSLYNSIISDIELEESKKSDMTFFREKLYKAMEIDSSKENSKSITITYKEPLGDDVVDFEEDCEDEAFEDLFGDPSQEPIIENPSIPMNIFFHIKNSKKGTYWFDEANEGIRRSNKYQTLKEFYEDYSWVFEDDETFKTDLKRIQIVHEKNFVEPIESEWVSIEVIQKYLEDLSK